MILSKLNLQDSNKYFLVVLLYLNKLLSSVLTESNCTVGNSLLNDPNIVYLLNLFLYTVFFRRFSICVFGSKEFESGSNNEGGCDSRRCYHMFIITLFKIELT